MASADVERPVTRWTHTSKLQHALKDLCLSCSDARRINLYITDLPVNADVSHINAVALAFSKILLTVTHLNDHSILLACKCYVNTHPLCKIPRPSNLQY